MSRAPYEDGKLTTAVGIRTTPETLRRLRIQAAHEGVSMAIMLGRLLETSLDQAEHDSAELATSSP